jgi:hypothetical protein
MRERLRFLPALFLACALSSCGGGVNAGEEGGVAFIGFTVMLVLTVAILYFFLGRED